MIPFPWNMLLSISILCAIAFLCGWNGAVRNYRVKRLALQEAVDQLEAAVATQNEKLAEDPMRAAIDIGKTNVLNQVESLLKQIRAAIA